MTKLPSLLVLSLSLFGCGTADLEPGHTVSALTAEHSLVPAVAKLGSPVKGGQDLKVIHGYNDPLPGETCTIGSSSDHCGNQQFGLDLQPSNKADKTILSPAAGQVLWTSPDCLGIGTAASLNLTVCHFQSFEVAKGDWVAVGTLLGMRSTSWIHLSLDNRKGAKKVPVPFTLDYTLAGKSFPDLGAGARDQYKGEVIHIL